MLTDRALSQSPGEAICPSCGCKKTIGRGAFAFSEKPPPRAGVDEPERECRLQLTPNIGEIQCPENLRSSARVVQSVRGYNSTHDKCSRVRGVQTLKAKHMPYIPEKARTSTNKKMTCTPKPTVKDTTAHDSFQQTVLIGACVRPPHINFGNEELCQQTSSRAGTGELAR
nr:hypothetical protein Iba_chr12eCG4690 [Ipomoea batatas]